MCLYLLFNVELEIYENFYVLVILIFINLGIIGLL